MHPTAAHSDVVVYLKRDAWQSNAPSALVLCWSVAVLYVGDDLKTC